VVSQGPVVVLCGPPGCGKTSTGAAVAELLGVDFLDTDAAIEAAQGRSISDIFLDDGEPRFRELERAEVARALSAETGVVALGGGALAGHRVLFLDVGIADAAKRVGFDRSRPLLAVNPRARWVELMAQRRSTYERLARARVDTSGREAPDVAAEVAELVRGWQQ
jgi:shikimate kinase